MAELNCSVSPRLAEHRTPPGDALTCLSAEHDCGQVHE